MMRDIYILSCAEDGGIYRYGFQNGELIFKDKTPLDRPMYAIKRDNKMLVILRETESENHFGGFLSFDIAEDGSLVNKSDIVSTKGIVPCHLEADGDVYVVNYLSGNIVKLPEKVVTHSGKGVHPTRQTAPHTHFVCLSPDKNRILCTDLGLDTIFLYDRDLTEKFSVKVPEGSGARHLCFSKCGKYLYCVNELSNDISVFEYNDGNPKILGTYKALPDYTGQSTAAAIRIKDEYLYISNRGADTISRFKIDGEKLILLENTDCGGVGPRDFEIIDNHIICTNEQSDSVTVLNLVDGKPLLTNSKIEIKAPLCVL